MSTSAPEQLHCSYCNDPISAFADAEAQRGRCCVNLPGHWRSYAPADQEDPPENDHEWLCPHCGSYDGVYLRRIEVYSGYLSNDVLADRHRDGDGFWFSPDDLDYDDTESVEVTCQSCERSVSGYIDLA